MMNIQQELVPPQARGEGVYMHGSIFFLSHACTLKKIFILPNSPWVHDAKGSVLDVHENYYIPAACSSRYAGSPHTPSLLSFLAAGTRSILTRSYRVTQHTVYETAYIRALGRRRK